MGTGTIEKVGVEAAGCWIDEANWGWRGPLRVIDIALGLGMSLDADDMALYDYATVCADREGSPAPRLILSTGDIHTPQTIWGPISGHGEMADSAEEWLNAHVAPDGFTFGWHDGSFMLWSVADWCVASGDACFCDPGEGCCE